MFESSLLILMCDFHPKLHIIVSLVGKEGLGEDGIEYDFSLHVQKGGEDGSSIFTTVFLERVDVLSH